MRIAINGFGRIGKLFFRSLLERNPDNIEIIAINDAGSLETNFHLLNYDSTHGKFLFKLSKNKNSIKYKNKNINFYSERNPKKLPWMKLNIDVVIECTGKFTSKEKSQLHLDAGAKKVLISAPGKNADATIVQGVNNHTLKKSHKIISNGSCTTNCLAPVAMILDKNFGIHSGFMTTVHSFTGDQNTVDQNHSDLRRARGAFNSLIPTSTGAAKALSLVLPQLKGRLDGTSIRVPSSNVSLIDFTFVSKIKTTKEMINKTMIKASKTKALNGILDVNNLPLVSIDFNHNSNSSIFDLTQTQVVKDKFCRILSWYDNEWGFSNRIIDTILDLKKLFK